ncbi:hypothetical protein PTKIN_Ptkin16aG0520700 [Pterospermum kingtungense]
MEEGTMSKSREEDEAYLMKSIPMGYKFRPTDFELIFYLSRKVDKKPLPPNRIWEVQLYNYDPETLTETNNNVSSNGVENEWYFFTPRDRKYQNGSRPDRRAGDGYWKATAANKRIKHDGKLVGFKRTLVFYWGKQPKGDKTNWLMHEYVLSDTPAREKANKGDMRLDEWVLCRVYKKQNNAKSKLVATLMGSDQEPDQVAVAPIIPIQTVQAQEQEHGIPHPQIDQQFQFEDFDVLPQQTYSIPESYDPLAPTITWSPLPPLGAEFTAEDFFLLTGE